MVSAVFHSPLATAAEDMAAMKVAKPVTKAAAPAVAAVPPRADAKPGYDWNGLLMAVMPPVLGLVLLVIIWSMVSMGTAGSIPTPWDTAKQAVSIFSDPFYRKGPNDQGVGWNVLASLQRVALGFGLAAVVGIPAGFVIGRFEFMSRMFNPLISLMRPVSPLAWLPGWHP